MLFKKYLEPNRKIRLVELSLLFILLIIATVCIAKGLSNINSRVGDIQYLGNVEMKIEEDIDSCDSDLKHCTIRYVNGDKTLDVTYNSEDTIKKTINAHEYINDDGMSFLFENKNPSEETVRDTFRQLMAEKSSPLFNVGIAFILLAIAILVVYLFSRFFSNYEKIWFISTMILATVFAILFPEESANGVNGIVIMLLYLMDTFLNVLCELLISKQSRYNFLVSVLVEITEIAMCVVLMYRFATMAVTLFFWLPIDIISFISWSRHKDEKEEELTVVRRLKGYQEVLVIVGIFVFTFVVGYFISGLDIVSDFIVSRKLETTIIYLDACASAVGIVNGLFILFRLREQWIAWYVYSIIDAFINILSGQYVLLILKLAFLVNTTYGFIKWSRYIKSRSSLEIK